MRLKAGQRAAVINAPDGYLNALKPLPADVELVETLKGKFDWAQVFVKNKAEKVTKVVSASKEKLVSMLEKVIEVLAKVTKAKQISDAAGKAYDKVTASAKSGANKAKEAMTAGVKALQRWATSVVNFITRPLCCWVI